MSDKPYKYLFGPVPSRRLGRSLGVDLLPYKVCTYDCIYCQIGRTTRKSLERADFVPINEVLDELKRKLDAGLEADYITLSGSGEPTLHLGCGELIRGIKALTDIPVAVLTNASLLWDPKVREALLPADLVVPSLDAGNAMMFERVNRPHPDLSFEKMVQGLIDFRREYAGKFWLEVFVLEGLTSLTDEISEIAEIVNKIDPDRVQLNTVARPPAEGFAHPAGKEEMEDILKLFGERAEVIAEFRGQEGGDDLETAREEILAMLERRPLTIDDVAISLKMHRNMALKYLNGLETSGDIHTRRTGDKVYYVRSLEDDPPS